MSKPIRHDHFYKQLLWRFDYGTHKTEWIEAGRFAHRIGTMKADIPASAEIVSLCLPPPPDR